MNAQMHLKKPKWLSYCEATICGFWLTQTPSSSQLCLCMFYKSPRHNFLQYKSNPIFFSIIKINCDHNNRIASKLLCWVKHGSIFKDKVWFMSSNFMLLWPDTNLMQTVRHSSPIHQQSMFSQTLAKVVTPVSTKKSASILHFIHPTSDSITMKVSLWLRLPHGRKLYYPPWRGKLLLYYVRWKRLVIEDLFMFNLKATLNFW
jgi:hypothetical protein